MKDSIFNSKLWLSENILAIYNSLTDKVIVASKNIIDINDLSHSPQQLLQKLASNGFVVEDDYDETSNYIRYVKEIENDTTNAHLIINPTINCNFHCWYCYETHSKSIMTQEIIDRLKKLIARIFSENRRLQISFFGGEPLLYYTKVMLPILEYTKSISEKNNGCFNVNMTTNGYLLTPPRILELKKYNFNGAQITLDGYKDEHDKVRFPKKGVGSYDTIVSHICELATNEVPVTVRINCTEKNINNIHKIIDTFADFPEHCKNKIDFDFHIVWQEERKDNVSSQLNQIVRKFVNHGLNASKMSFRNFCYADKRNAYVVNFNGDLYKCTAIDFDKVKRDGYLSKRGELIWENDSLEKRMASKLKNKRCLICRILPLCHGGCTKHSLSAEEDYCIYNYNDEEMNEVVLDVIEHNIQLGKIKRI